jgi:PKD repeat protein
MFVYNYSKGSNHPYALDYGEGGSRTDQYPVHTFLTTGTFNVCLTIDDGNGCTDSLSQTITVWTKASGITIRIYTPSNGDFTISFNTAEVNNCQISILDLQGKMIVTKTIENNRGQNQVNFDLKGIARGVYFWQFDQRTAGKLIVE